MKKAQFAEFILGHARLRWEAELQKARDKAAGEGHAVKPVDPQVEQIKEFLRGNPFGCKSEEARKFAELVSGKKIEFDELRKASKYTQRLRIYTITADSNGAYIPVGTPVLSLDRSGHCVYLVVRAGGTETHLQDSLPRVLKVDTRRPTEAEANALFAGLAASLDDLGDVLINSIPLVDLCELER